MQTWRLRWGNSKVGDLLGVGKVPTGGQWITGLSGEKNHGRAREFWKGECSLALDLAYLAIVNVSLDYLHTHHELLLNLRVFYKHYWKIECLLGWHKKVTEAVFLLVQRSQHHLHRAGGAAVLSSWQGQA